MTSQPQKTHMDTPQAISAALIISAVGAIFYNVLPMFLGVAQDERSWTDSQIGFLGASFFAGYNLVTLSAFFWLRNVNWRRLVFLAAPIAAASLAATTIDTSYSRILLYVALSGGAFSAIYGVGTVAIGDTVAASRLYGAKIGAETALGGLFLIVVPLYIVAEYGFVGTTLAIAATALLVLPFLYWLPAYGIKHAAPASNDNAPVSINRGEKLGILLTILAIVIFFTGQTAAWSFVERIGMSSGFDSAAVGTVLALTLGFAMLGALSEAAVGERFGFRKPFFFANALFVVSMMVLANAADIVSYGIGACALMFSVGFGISIAVASVAFLDRDGRYIVLSVPALGLGAMFGPAFGGLVYETLGAQGLLYVSIATALLSAFTMGVAIPMGRAARSAASETQGIPLTRAEDHV